MVEKSSSGGVSVLPSLTRNGFVQSSGSSIRLSEAILTVGVKIGGPSSPIEGVSEDPLNNYVEEAQ